LLLLALLFLHFFDLRLRRLIPIFDRFQFGLESSLGVRNFFFISHLFVCDTRAPLSFSPPFSKVNQARGNLLFPDPQFLSLGFLSVSAICRPTHFIPCSIFSPHFQSISFHFFPLCWEPCKNKYTYQWAWGFFNIFLAYCSRDVPRPLSAQPFP